MKKIIIAISSIWMLTVSSAMSMEFKPSIGISGNMGVYAATGTEKNYNNAGSAVDTTVDEHGAFASEFGSIFVEAALNDTISIGLDYASDFETPENISNEDQGNQRTVSAEFTDLTTVYAKLNIPLGGAYLKVGYSQADVTSNENGGSGNSYGNDTTSGMTVGLGYNQEVSGGVSVRLEVTGTNFSDVKVDNGQTNKTEISIKEMIGARGTFSIVKSF
jgi:opacity protein-like surface antigen